MFRSLTLITVATLGFTLHTPGARAEADKLTHVGSVRVEYGDLDIQKEADARELLERLNRAAFKACGGEPRWHPQYDLIPRRVTRVFRDCREAAVAQAVSEVDARALWAAFANSERRRQAETARDARS
jgi:UrcA family protein